MVLLPWTPGVSWVWAVPVVPFWGAAAGAGGEGRGTVAWGRCWVAGETRDRTATAEGIGAAMCIGRMDPSWETETHNTTIAEFYTDSHRKMGSLGGGALRWHEDQYQPIF